LGKRSTNGHPSCYFFLFGFPARVEYLVIEFRKTYHSIQLRNAALEKKHLHADIEAWTYCKGAPILA